MAASRESQCNQLRPGLPGRGFPTPCFLLLRQTSRHFFHTLPSPSKAPRPILIFCWRPAHFLGFSRSKIAKTLPGPDATSVLCPFSFQPSVGAYVGRAHMYAHFGAIACMRSHSPSATSYFSICRGGGSQLRFFSTPSNVATLFPHVAVTIHSTHANSRIFPALGAFSRVFQVENRQFPSPTFLRARFVSVFVPTFRGGLRWPCPHVHTLWCNCMHAIT